MILIAQFVAQIKLAPFLEAKLDVVRQRAAVSRTLPPRRIPQGCSSQVETVLTGGLLTLALCGMVRCRLSLAQLGWSVASPSSVGMRTLCCGIHDALACNIPNETRHMHLRTSTIVGGPMRTARAATSTYCPSSI